MRPHWDDYFMLIADAVSVRMDCDRARVGAVLVSADRFILATGYGGAPAGSPDCDRAGHMMVNGHCVRTIHAEVNALAQAARHGTPTEGATCFVTLSPCYNCAKLLVAGGVEEIVYRDPYHHEDERRQVYQLCTTAGVKLRRFTPGASPWRLTKGSTGESGV